MRAYAYQNLDGNFHDPYKEGDRLLLCWIGEVAEAVDDIAAAEAVFELLNRDTRPNRMIAPSLSVGDVVTLVSGGSGRARSLAVERAGFRPVPEIIPEQGQARTYHRALDEAAEVGRPLVRREQADEPPPRPALNLGQPLANSPEVEAVNGWLVNVRERLVDDSDAYADVDLIYNLYRALTGEDIDHPWEGEDEPTAMPERVVHNEKAEQQRRAARDDPRGEADR